jgi:putative tryptophan/tyrosine transport system substrate-binding protein
VKRREFITLLGGAAAWPLAARGQQPVRMSRIAIVHPVVPPEVMRENSESPFYRSFFSELRRLGYIEGKDIVIERRSGEGRTDRYSEIARELVGLKPDVMVVTSARILEYFRQATTTIPIIAMTGDPILFNIVSNVSRPEGNVTGFSADASLEVHGKYLEFLKQLKPTLSKVGLLSARLSWEPYGRPLRAIAERLGLEIVGPPLEHPFGETEFRRVIAAMVDGGADGLLVTAAAENFPRRGLIVALAEKHQLPAIYPFAEYVKLGGLMGYALDAPEIGVRAAGYVDRLLHGAKPSDLPYYMPTKIRLLINVATAKGLGLNIPDELLTLADEVIE